MPKLPKEVQQAMQENAENPSEGGFILFTPGLHRCVMAAIKTVPKKPGQVADQVEIDWRPVEGPNRGKEIRHWISMSPKAAFRMCELFDAYGYTYDSDLDELMDDSGTVLIEVTHEMQAVGKNKGKVTHKVETVYPDDDERAALVLTA